MEYNFPQTKRLDIRWSDIDPNFHMRHSVYYDFGAAQRTEVLNAIGLTMAVFAREKVGPALFEEKCQFKRELHFGDEVDIKVEIVGLSRDFERFAFRHTFVKTDGTIAAILTLNGAWIDTVKRKLTLPPKMIEEAFDKLPKADDFEWIATSKSPK